MPDPDFDAAALLRVLTAHSVRFIVIGGLAALLQGSPYQTEDCDVTPESTLENLERLSAALHELDARVRAEGGTSLAFAHDGRSLGNAAVWNLVTRYGLLDISMCPAGTTGYGDLARDARTLDIDGLSVAVASLADVIRSKQAANRDKDHRTLPLLRRLLAEQED